MRDVGKYNLKNKFTFSVALLVLSLDQITKYFALSTKVDKPIVKNIFHLTFSENYGAGFSILQNQTMFLILITLVVVGAIFYFYQKIPNIKYVVISVALILGGALGNLVDRIRLGYVVDFLDFQVWPIFNIADSAITIGAIGLIIYFWNE